MIVPPSGLSAVTVTVLTKSASTPVTVQLTVSVTPAARGGEAGVAAGGVRVGDDHVGEVDVAGVGDLDREARRLARQQRLEVRGLGDGQPGVDEIDDSGVGVGDRIAERIIGGDSRRCW